MLFRIYVTIALVYILYLLTVHISDLKYLTTWTIVTQGLYFASEHHWNIKIPNFFQNLTWTLSIFLIVYWPLKYYFHWDTPSTQSYWIHDLMIHGINILLVIGAVIAKPRLEYRLAYIPMLAGGAYLIFAIIYTAHGHTIYPTNFFKTDYRLIYDAIAVLLGAPAIHCTGVWVTKQKDRLDKYSILPTAKKGWWQKTLLQTND